MTRQKRFIIFCILTFCLLLPLKVRALTGSLTFNCSANETKPGATVTCDLTASASELVSSIEIPFSITNATLLEFKSTNLWIWPDDVSNGKIEQTAENTNSMAIGDFGIGRFTIKINDGAEGSAVISLHDVLFNDEAGMENTITPISKTINIIAVEDNPSTTTNDNQSTTTTGTTNSETETESDDNDDVDENDKRANFIDDDSFTKAYLSDIQIDGYKLDFDEGKFSYDLTINKENVLSITPVVKYQNVTYTINNNKSLKNGSVITIVVKDVNGNTNEYYINIIKKGNNNLTRAIFISIIAVLIFVNIWRILNKRNKSKIGEGYE